MLHPGTLATRLWTWSTHLYSRRVSCMGCPPPLHVDHEFLVPHNRRGHGGVAILWWKILSDVHKLTEFASHHHIGISVCNHLKIFSTYLPTRSGCTDIYKEALDHLNVIREKYSDNGILIFAGEMNADIGTSDGPLATTTINEQGRILSHYLKATQRTPPTHMKVSPTPASQPLIISFAHSIVYHLLASAPLLVTSPQLPIRQTISL